MPSKQTSLTELNQRGFYQTLTDLGQGKLPTRVCYSLPVSLKGEGSLEVVGKLHPKDTDSLKD